MKKVLLVCLLFAAVFSCNFSENIYINEDGTGKMEFSFDGSQLMQMGGEKMAGESEERIDSTIVFKDFFEEKKDSIAQLSKEEQDKLKALEPFTMTMLMDPETSELKMKIFNDFKDVNELQDMFKAMNNVSNLKGKGATDPMDNSNPFSSFGEDGATDLKYRFDGKIFKREATIVDEEAYSKLTDSLGQLEIMFGASKYKLNYHFPRRVKSVSNEKAMFSQDGKTLTLEYGFMEYLKNPKALDLEVILED
ncbi:hypothetical protein [Winogradskyella sp. SYSU M77433]|uniref:hypothetical protein n=1 Tax=Winogradskyella sp. SYSU M77433 TaxID=3042722 RepID=UPI002480AA75|nr:hypothetical protein [Winogradskyella sp. SYSU M77433]MDH7911771.1 hypothetical protein [Winogradskyella sp. SYSU M77433]